jgi:hypothetical protein
MSNSATLKRREAAELTGLVARDATSGAILPPLFLGRARAVQLYKARLLLLATVIGVLAGCLALFIMAHRALSTLGLRDEWTALLLILTVPYGLALTVMREWKTMSAYRYLMDRVLGLLILPVAIAIVAPVAAIVFLGTKRKPLVGETRIGQQGRPFRLLLFIGHGRRFRHLRRIPAILLVATGRLALFGRRPMLPSSLGAEPFYLDELGPKPGIFRLPASADPGRSIAEPKILESWRSVAPPEAALFNNAPMLMLFPRVEHHNGKRRVLVLPFAVSELNEWQVKSQVSILDLGSPDPLLGYMKHADALILAAWVAWQDIDDTPGVLERVLV